jgi:hypothetical protein
MPVFSEEDLLAMQLILTFLKKKKQILPLIERKLIPNRI